MHVLHLLGIGKLPCEPEAQAVGGVTRVALELARAQRALGHEVTVATLARAGARGTWQGVKLASLRHGPHLSIAGTSCGIDLSRRWPYWWFTKLGRFDAVHLHEVSDARGIRAPLRIAHFHNDPCCTPAHAPPARWALRGFLTAARGVQACVGVSEFVSRQIGRLAAGVSPGPARVAIARIYNGVDLERFRPDRWQQERMQWRERWGAAPEDLVVLYAGAMAADKGVLPLIWAFARAAASTRALHLVLAGDARLWEDAASRPEAYREHLAYERQCIDALQRAREHGRVHRLGLVPIAQMPELYAACDVVAVPSVVQEAFSLAALEGLAMGRPVIASATGGIPEVVPPGVGLLVNPEHKAELAQAIQRLAADRTLCASMGAAAIRHAGSFSWTETALGVERLYARLRSPQPLQPELQLNERPESGAIQRRDYPRAGS
jgi:glycosyltransferase involved in cell wall biosynthesis